MGIPGLLKEIGKGERVALAKLAIEHLEKTKRPLRIAIDAAIWNFQHQAGQGGKNPALRTLFFRSLKLLALPIHPVFVYDGKNKPLTKRGKTVSRYGTCIPNEMSKNLAARFQFPHHTAPGEAEAECAFLQKHGIVDAVMSQDADAIMFGSTVTYRDWSKEGTKGNKSPTHVNVFDLQKIEANTGLDTNGMILVALLSGGDYHDGLPGFGPGLSCSIARAGFGKELVEILQDEDEQGLRDWRERLRYELETNESGYFAKRHMKVKVPEDFPNRTILGYYLNPAVSSKEELKTLERRWTQWWAKDIDVPALRDYTAMTFDWLYKGGARNFVRKLAQPLFQHRLKTQQINENTLAVPKIHDRRKHIINDGIPELRISAVPIDVVGIDLDAEVENPEFAELDIDNEDEAETGEAITKVTSEDLSEEPSSPSKKRRRPPWDPQAAEKWWIPETLLRIGLPATIDAWDQEQIEIATDPVKFATRKCHPAAKTSKKTEKKIDRTMKPGALEDYLLVVRSPEKEANVEKTVPQSQPILLSSRTTTVFEAPPIATQESNIDDYFRVSKPSSQAEQEASQSKEKSLQRHGFLSALNEVETASPVSPARTRKRSSSRERRQTLELPALSKNITKVPPTVTQRRRRQPEEDVDEVVFVGSKKLPPSIASFFGRNCKGPATAEEQAVVESVLSQQPMLGPALGTKKVAASRDSLPGTWQELSVMTSQKTRISFIDLTDD